MKFHNPFGVALVATLGVGVGLLLIGGIETLSTILLYVGTALFLSLGLEPIDAFLVRRGLRRAIAVLITVVLVLALFAGIVLVVVPVIFGQVAQLISQVEDFVQNTSWDDFVGDIETWIQSTFPGIQIDVIAGYVTDWFNSLDLGSISGT